VQCFISFRDVQFVPGGYGVTISVVTDVACHLYVRRTDVEPQIHKKSGTRRGYNFIEDLRFCFVSFTEFGQNEAGDTFTHTFTFADWTFCKTFWVYFFGKVGTLYCVSTSPVFKFHNTVPVPTIITVGDPIFTTGTSGPTGWTYFSRNVPALGTGVITLVSVWPYLHSGTYTVRIGIFGNVGGTNYLCRSAFQGTASGAGQKNFVVNLAIQAGDYIGTYGYTAYCPVCSTGGILPALRAVTSGNKCKAGLVTSFPTNLSNNRVSLRGSGHT
jgi:hypothetical protein